jgi:hypothetical protein
MIISCGDGWLVVDGWGLFDSPVVVVVVVVVCVGFGDRIFFFFGCTKIGKVNWIGLSKVISSKLSSIIGPTANKPSHSCEKCWKNCVNVGKSTGWIQVSIRKSFWETFFGHWSVKRGSAFDKYRPDVCFSMKIVSRFKRDTTAHVEDSFNLHSTKRLS